MKPADLLARVRAIRAREPAPAAPTAPTKAAAPRKAPRAVRANGHARAEQVQYVTTAQFREHDAQLLDAIGTVLACAAEEFGKTYFQRGSFLKSLSATVAAAPERTRPFVRRVVAAVYDFRAPPPIVESYADRAYREAHGAPRPG